MMTTTMTTTSRGAASGSEWRRGLRDVAPVLPAVGAIGLVFGAQAVRHGLRLAEVPLMTGANYAGGSEFAAIALWAAPPPLLLIVAVTALINSRHLVMGAVLAPHLRHLRRRTALPLLFLMSDECWAVSLAEIRRRAEAGREPGFSTGHYLGCGTAIFLCWILCTTVGAAVGTRLGDVDAYGFGMAFPAVFLVILAGLWRGGRDAGPWAASLLTTATVHLLVPGAWAVVAGILSGMGTAALRKTPEWPE